jgi:CO/xanthine dehydrogenase FAD-binding subunit
MVISIASFGLVIDADARRVGTGIGSAGPRILVASDAERELAAALEQNDAWSDPSPLADDVVTRFGELVSAAASPIDDVRGSARYRRHALDVVAQRTLRWAWNDYRSAVTTCA